MPRRFTQADYNKSSPSPHDVSLDASSNWDNVSTLEISATPYGSQLNPHQSYQITKTQGKKAQYITPDNTSNLPLSGRKSKQITPDNHHPTLATRQASEKGRSPHQTRDESIASNYAINLTRMEELFPDFTQGNVHEFSPPAASLPNAKELVSGVFQDGTPVFSPHLKKPRASRFVPASHDGDNSTKVDVTTTEDMTPRLDVKKSRGSRFDLASHIRDSSAKVDNPAAEDVTPQLERKKPRGSRFGSTSHVGDNSGKVDVPTAEDITPKLEAKKPRGSRFGSNSHSRDMSLKVEPVAEEVPPPFDAEKVMASIDFLERKVAALERNRTQDEMTIQQLQLERRVSKAESKDKKKWHRSDSALGSTDGGSERGDEMGSSQRKLIVEKNRLEASVRTLQEQITLLNQAASESEINLDKITKDRDSAVSQLGVAYFTMEQLKAENQTLRERNAMLKDSVDQLIANQEDTTMDMTAREEALDREFERRARIDDKERELQKQKKLENQLNATLPDPKPEFPRKETAPESEKLHKGQVTRSGSVSSRSSTADDNDSTKDLTYLSVVSTGEIGELRKTLEKERIARSKKRSYRHQATNSDVMIGENHSDERSQQLTATYKSAEASHRPGSKTGFLIEEKISSDKPQQPISTSKSPEIEPVRRRVSNTVSLTEKAFSADDRSQQAQRILEPSEIQPERLYKDTSAMSTGSSHGKDKSESVVSDWIVNDFTLDFTGYEGRDPPTPSQEAEIPYFEDLPPIFTRRVEQGSETHGKELNVIPNEPQAPLKKPNVIPNETQAPPPKVPKVIPKESKILPKPVPVREPIMEAAPYEEEPTLRPSQSPELALASVINGLEDELSIAKRQLAQYQDLYNNQNPALAKRARKSLKDKMEALLRTIDGKADYIYSLYDVVEGQKQHGEALSETDQKVLKSLGVDMTWAGL